MRLFTIAVALWGSLAFGQLKLAPVAAKPGEYAPVQAEGADKTIRWYSHSTYMKVYSGNDHGAIIYSIRPGKYLLSCLLPTDPPQAAACWVTIAGTPIPDPPTPPVPPITKPAKVNIVIIEKTANPFPNRGAYLVDSGLMAVVANKVINGRRCIFDKDAIGPDGKPPASLVPYLNAAKGKDLPFLFITDPAGNVLYKDSLPKTPAELASLILSKVQP